MVRVPQNDFLLFYEIIPNCQRQPWNKESLQSLEKVGWCELVFRGSELDFGMVISFSCILRVFRCY